MPINRIDHATLRVDDLTTSLEWYVQGAGMSLLDKSSDTAHLGFGDDHTALTLVEGGKGLVSFALGVDSEGDLDTYEARLRGAGSTIDRRRHEIDRAGASQILSAELPSGHRIELQTGSAGRTAGLPNQAAWDGVSRRPLGLDHINLVSEDSKGLLSFLSTTLDVQTSQVLLAPGGNDDWRFFWARTSEYHHDIACADAPGVRGGLHHLAFLVDGIEHMKLICDSLTDVKRVVEYGPGRHPELNLFLYAFDPSGNRIEFSAEMPKISAGDEIVWSSPDTPMNAWSSWVPDTFFTTFS